MSNANGKQRRSNASVATMLKRRSSNSTTTLVKPQSYGAIVDSKKQWSGEPATYYGLPLIKKATWTWEIIVYFFLGGIAGGAYLVSSIADFIWRDKSLIRSGRYLSLLCMLASPVLLIMDLGRPERFYRMLRILKFRSVMSIGTWAISCFGLFCGLASAYQMAQDGLLNWFPLMARLLKVLPIKVIDVLGSFFGLVVASYTGVLLSSTAVPLWARARHVLGPLFLTSGLSTGLSALSLILSLGKSKGETIERLDTAETLAMTAELGLIGSLLPLLGPLAKPLFKGKTGAFFTVGTISGGLILPLILKLSGRATGKRSRSLTISTSVMVLVGGLILRAVWILAGRTSADNPRDVHYYNAKEWAEGKH